MVPDNFPRGKFSYGAAGAVILDVVYVEGKTTLVPVQDLVDRALGRADELRVNPADIMKLAARAGVTPLDAAHFMIAYHAAKVAVGRAIPALSAALLNAPTLWELVSGDISSQEFAARRALRDLLAIEMAGAVARRHPNPVDRHGLERRELAREEPAERRRRAGGVPYLAGIQRAEAGLEAREEARGGLGEPGGDEGAVPGGEPERTGRGLDGGGFERCLHGASVLARSVQRWTRA